MLHDSSDSVTVFESTGTADRDLAYEAWVDDVARNNAAAEEAELDLLAAQAEREAAAGFHDLTAEKYADLMQHFPFGYGWAAVIGYNAGAAKPFTAELRRGTPAGPDVARVGAFSCAESALRNAIMFALEMLIAQTSGTEADKAAVRARIVYALPITPANVA
jgi:hypothetical protein